MTPLRILIVEDEWSIAYDHSCVLQAAGHIVVGPVPSVDRALLLIANEAIDVALLDYRLDGHTSIALAAPLRERGIPFVLVTGHVAPDMPEPFRSSPLVSKPVEAATLVDTVEALAAQRPG